MSPPSASPTACSAPPPTPPPEFLRSRSHVTESEFSHLSASPQYSRLKSDPAKPVRKPELILPHPLLAQTNPSSSTKKALYDQRRGRH
ncbi:hypothetical protein M413DRAFT_119636 [Hebeloma cylindrosporum]|uniref:Uncharacterized protein n=1 Tax=Hebeloma cylindrosporum TaxID=76867 RepID=A0A0C3CFY5_HEBCY|nr:hypothetical protein M413DRAFT_119636 [Hebeloma cylindrosporum h7]